MLTVKQFGQISTTKKRETKFLEKNNTGKKSNENLSPLNKAHFSGLFVNNKISFGRKPNAGDEADFCLQTLEDARKILNIKVNAEIVPGTCFPIGKITLGNGQKAPVSAVGSPYSAAAKEFIIFSKNQGINAIQLGPTGEITRGNTSPYSSTVFGLNTLYIDPLQLLEAKWGGILKKSTVQELAKENIGNNPDYVDYNKAFNQNNRLKKEIYNNFKTQNGDPTQLKQISTDFKQFQTDNSAWLDKYAHYEALTDINGNDYFGNWKNDVDRNLYVYLNGKDAGKKQAAQNRINDLNTNHKDQIEEYKFAQFVAFEQAKDMNKFMKTNNMSFIGDAEVGSSNKDMWTFQTVFDPRFKIGCEDGNQRWGFPLVNPDKIFQTDSNGNIKYNADNKPLLGEGGKYIQAKYSNIFKNCKGGVRIDNVTGTIDPEVYTDDGGFSNLSYTGRDPHQYYSQVMEKIILPAAKENGVDPKTIFGEDIAKKTDLFNRIFYGKLGMSGVNVLQYQRGQDIKDPNSWAMIGSHDNKTLKSYVSEDARSRPYQIDYLAGYLVPNNEAARENFKQTLRKDDMELAKATLVELDTCPTVNKETFWPDNIIYTDARYNTPGSMENCWKLKINENYENQFYNGVANKSNPYNPHETFRRAINARDAMAEAEGRSHDDHSELSDKLEKAANILREPMRHDQAFTHNSVYKDHAAASAPDTPAELIKAYHVENPQNALKQMYPNLSKEAPAVMKLLKNMSHVLCCSPVRHNKKTKAESKQSKN